MQLTFNQGTFVLHNSMMDFKDLIKAVPTSKWNPEDKTWTYQSTPESREVLLVLVENGLFGPSEEAMNELELSKKQVIQKEAVRGIKVKEIIKVDVPLKVELYSHQKKAFKIGTTLDKAGLLMEQGTGKTLSSLAIAGHRYLQGQIKKLLIVAPLSTLTPWEREITRFVDYPVEIVNLEKVSRKKRNSSLDSFKTEALQILLINHQMVWRIYPELDKWGADMIIVDESQRIKNGQAKQSRALHKLGDKVLYKLILTGTPVTQGPLDVWSQYRFLDADIFGRSFYKFRARYARMGGFKNYKVIGFRNLEDLTEKAHSVAYRVKKEDTEIDLPPVVNQYLYTTLGKTAIGYYKEMEKDFQVTLNEQGENVKAPIILTKMLRLQQIAGGFLTVETEGEKNKVVRVDESKLTLLKELVEDMPSEKKIVIFARFIAEVNAIQKSLEELGRRVVTLTGKTENRGDVIEQFSTDADLTILVAQIQTGGVGINLQVADTAIFYSTNFSYSDYDQAKARIHRIGQKSQTVTYIHLVCEKTIDEEIIQALDRKKDVATHIVDKYTN